MKVLIVIMLYIMETYFIFSINNPPSCRNCRFFKFSLSGNEFSKCTKFGTIIKDTNVIRYEYADLSRLDEDKCGPKGKYYENKKFRDVLDVITDERSNNKI
jgi:hypothetical protein